MAADVPEVPQLYAQTADEISEPTPKKKKRRKRRRRRRKRRKKKKVLNAQPEEVKAAANSYGAAITTGFFQGNIGYGGELYFNLGEDAQIVGQFLLGSNDVASEQPASNSGEQQQKISYSTQDIGIKLRMKVWEGLYISGGLGYDTISGDHSVGSTTVGYTSTALMFKGSLGYQEIFADKYVIGMTAGTFAYPYFLETAFTNKTSGIENNQVFTAITDGEDPNAYMSKLLSPQLQLEIGMVYAGMMF